MLLTEKLLPQTCLPDFLLPDMLMLSTMLHFFLPLVSGAHTVYTSHPRLIRQSYTGHLAPTSQQQYLQ